MRTVTFDETKWQLVPKVPTVGMVYLAQRTGVSVQGCYIAMLDAAPEHPEAEPLTDEEVLKIGADNGIGYVRQDNSVIPLNSDEAEYFIAFARAIEKRIKEVKA